MHDFAVLTSVLVPIAICVVLPVSIVLIVCLASINRENKRAKVLIKAIEANNNIDADKLAEAMRKPKKTSREILNLRLLRGCIASALGLGFVIYGFYSGTIPHYGTDWQNMVFFAAAVCLAIGIGYLVVYFITRKSVDK